MAGQLDDFVLITCKQTRRRRRVQSERHVAWRVSARSMTRAGHLTFWFRKIYRSS